jgi:hypothetical protein
MKQRLPTAALLKKFLPVQASAHAKPFQIAIDLAFRCSGRPRFDEGTAVLYLTKPTSQLETTSQPSVCASANRTGPETISSSPPQSVTGWSRRRVFKSHATMGTSKRVATANTTGGPRPRSSTQRAIWPVAGSRSLQAASNACGSAGRAVPGHRQPRRPQIGGWKRAARS